ncbi:hypothetical protein GGI43DRAFT_307694 [Trichoderma evansii]
MLYLEPISLLSGIITIISISIQLYEIINDISGLSRSFRDVADRLPAIRHTLKDALHWLAREEDAGMLSAERYIALFRILESCHRKTIAVQRILQRVIADTNTSIIKRCAKAIKAISSANAVDSLMQEIFHDLHVIAANRAVNIAPGPRLSVTYNANAASRGGARHRALKPIEVDKSTATPALYALIDN